ncbi:hypothetical protein IFM89_022310 [Coptis chinensis]|uniref:non-specific serine/threonine protein kinase n=1 Tax=Coptis chinensis TaxID=261450 RepID=A0A835I4L2_9MAGN|nr:hypothetical protein IFM89_022310 [Coptis chinensis]
MDLDLEEGVGESCSPVRGNFVVVSGFDVKNDVYNRLIENGNEEAICNTDFRDQLDAHFHRLPARYALDVNLDRVEDVLLHQKLLALAKEPEKRPVFHVRFMENVRTRPEGNDDLKQCITIPSTSMPDVDGEPEGNMPSNSRHVDNVISPCSKLEDLNLDIRKNAKGTGRLHLMQNIAGGQEILHVPIHEITFSTIDKPKLLSQLSALLSDIGLNIREAHVFSTVDGFSLDVFVVDGWHTEDTDGLQEAVGAAVSRSEGSWSGSSSQSVIEKALAGIAAQMKSGNWEIDRRLVKIGEKIASGSCGNLHQGVYHGEDVAVKILKSEHLKAHVEEFTQEVMILGKVQHRNVVRFIGACTKLPDLCIITELMPGGSVYDYLHKHHNILQLPLLLKFAINVCKGMEYLHRNNIIHRDLKTANLLMNSENVIKVTDFGVARFQSEGGEMTAETGTYRWMAPEGLRPELPDNGHPKVLDLMQRCWDADPSVRPSFSEIAFELEELLQDVQQAPP